MDRDKAILNILFGKYVVVSVKKRYSEYVRNPAAIIETRAVNYNAVAKHDLQLAFVNKVLLLHSRVTHWHIAYGCFLAANLTDHMPCKPSIFAIWILLEKACQSLV